MLSLGAAAWRRGTPRCDPKGLTHGLIFSSRHRLIRGALYRQPLCHQIARVPVPTAIARPGQPPVGWIGPVLPVTGFWSRPARRAAPVPVQRWRLPPAPPGTRRSRSCSSARERDPGRRPPDSVPSVGKAWGTPPTTARGRFHRRRVSGGSDSHHLLNVLGGDESSTLESSAALIMLRSLVRFQLALLMGPVRGWRRYAAHRNPSESLIEIRQLSTRCVGRLR